MSEGKKVTVNLTELDLKIVLEALGRQEIIHTERRESPKATQIVIEKSTVQWALG